MKVCTAFVLFVFVTFAKAQTLTFNIQNFRTEYVKIHSDWYTATVSNIPNGTVFLAPSANDVTFDPATLTFDPTQLQQTFRLTAHVDGLLTVSFSTSGDAAADFFTPSDRFLLVQKRSITIDPLPALVMSVASEPLQVILQFPSSQLLTITPGVDPSSGIVFVPSSFDIEAGEKGAVFTIIGSLESSAAISVNWTIAGAESDLYYTPSVSYISAVYQKTFTPPAFSAYSLVGNNATQVYAYARLAPSESITLVPTAADTTFEPAKLEFNADQQVVPVTIVTSSPVTKQVFYYVEGSNERLYSAPALGSIGVAKRPFHIVTASNLIIGKTVQMSVQITAPAPTDVELTFFAANLEFNPSNITFQGPVTSIVVDITPIALGPDHIAFTLTGSDADWFILPAPISVSVSKGSFIGPDLWYIPALWVGVPSPALPLRVNVAPNDSVTVTPSCPDMVFDPPTLTFTAATRQVYFTMTPTPTNADMSNYVNPNLRVTFLLTGPDYLNFNAPSDYRVVVGRRYIQISWAAEVPQDSLSVKHLHLMKTYHATASVNYLPNKELKVTPINPHITFEPKVFTFSKDVRSVTFKATSHGAIGDSSIKYVIDGEEGGYYQPIPDDQVKLLLRPLIINSAVKSPVDIVAGINVVDPSALDLALNHTFSFALRVGVLPDSKLTITPRSTQIEFDPKSIELTPDSKTTLFETRDSTFDNSHPHTFLVPNNIGIANFTLKPISRGIHEVWIELTGDDRHYYDIPDHFWVGFTTVSVPPHSAAATSFTGVNFGYALLLLLVVVGLI